MYKLIFTFGKKWLITESFSTLGCMNISINNFAVAKM